MHPRIACEHLNHRWPDGHAAVRDVTLDVAAGARVAVLGPSGAGKSTLLRCLSGALTPTSGAIHFDGAPVHDLRGTARRHHRTRIGVIHQRFHLVGRLSVLDNVLAGRLGHRRSPVTWLRRFPAEDRELAVAALARVGLADLHGRRADRLSGGQQQRVAIARVLCQQASLLLADEPVASLDPRAAEGVMDLLTALADAGQTLLMNLHDVGLARERAQRVIGYRDGAVRFDLAAADLDDATAAALYA